MQFELLFHSSSEQTNPARLLAMTYKDSRWANSHPRETISYLHSLNWLAMFGTRKLSPFSRIYSWLFTNRGHGLMWPVCLPIWQMWMLPMPSGSDGHTSKKPTWCWLGQTSWQWRWRSKKDGDIRDKCRYGIVYLYKNIYWLIISCWKYTGTRATLSKISKFMRVWLTTWGLMASVVMRALLRLRTMRSVYRQTHIHPGLITKIRALFSTRVPPPRRSTVNRSFIQGSSIYPLGVLLWTVLSGKSTSDTHNG